MNKTRVTSFIALIALLVFVASCKKETSNAEANLSATTTGAIAVGTTVSVSSSLWANTTNSKDSLYVVNCFKGKSKRDTVTFSSLPVAIGTYLTANYASYTFKKAHKLTDVATSAVSYVIIINLNNNPIGLKFTADGTFVSVLEQRAGADLHKGPGKGFHEGGPFGNRDGKKRDTVALTAIPTVVKAFFTITYPKDTLLHAFVTRDTTYMLISKNVYLYATGIKLNGTLVNRMQINAKPAKPVAVVEANLPKAVANYLTTTYPAYVFNKAFAVSNNNNAIQGYHVFITASSTNYVVEFDAAGVFIRAKVVR